MASPFDAQIPPWMQDNTSPARMFLEGSQVGSQIASNIIRARQAQMQAEETAAQVGSIMANTEMKREQLQELNRENTTWLNEDSQSIPKWMMTPMGKLDTVATPEPKSQRGTEIVQKRQALEQQYRTKEDMIDVREMQANNAIDIAKIRAANNAQAVKDQNEWQNGFMRLNTANRNTIVSDKENLGPDGLLTPKGRGIVNDFLRLEGKDEVGKPKAESQRAYEGLRQENRLELEGAKQEGRVDLEKQREAGRTQLEKLRQTNRLSIKDASGRTVSEREFVNRHFNTVYNNIAKSTGEIADAGMVVQILQLTYQNQLADKSGKQDKAAQGSVTGTNAPSAGTNAPALKLVRDKDGNLVPATP